MVSLEKSVFILIDLHLYVCFFFLTVSNIHYLLSVLVDLMIICHREVLFWSRMFGAMEALSTWIGIFSLDLGILCYYFIVILLIPLACTSSPSSMPWFSGLVFWWSCWVLAYSFHSSWVVWLRVPLFFSLISIISSSLEILSSTYFSVLEWLSTLFFILQ
jgi:hypothetical protein